MHKKTTIIVLTLLLVYSNHPVSAQISEVQLEVDPELHFRQISHGESYNFSITFNSTEYIVNPGESVHNISGLIYTGNLITSLNLEWNGKGSYDFGESTTGYTFYIDQVELNQTIPFQLNESLVVRYNYSFERDSFQLGINPYKQPCIIKPYEDVEITATISVYHEAKNVISGEKAKGPQLISSSQEYHLLDDIKINYLEGKYQDMEAEINQLDELSTIETFDDTAYYKLLNEMNNSMTQGDYIRALDVYQSYDEDERKELVIDLAEEINNSLIRIEELLSLSSEVTRLERELENCEQDYENLESDYNALSNTYQRKQAELEAAKRNLTTAITAVFLASVFFFFLGRRSKNPKSEEISRS
jgi:hypothetical protein